ncbi:hypothetical protein [Streptomyces sp. NPDC047042]|uniref:hypothetical protein n=1 Tax=Streptomyces sp. NPDC047042 TaxID=3154807 RepID=UPI0033DDCBA4
MNESSLLDRLDRALDRVGPIPAAVLLAFGIDRYRDGGSIGWPIGGAVMLLASFWVIYRGRARGRKGDARKP